MPCWIQSDGSELITTGLDYVDRNDFSAGAGDEWFVAYEPSCVSNDSHVGRVNARAK